MSGRRIRNLHGRFRRVKDLKPDASDRSAYAQRAGNRVRGGKRPTPGTKTPGAFLNNATRWPGYGRTSGMRCVIAWAERPWMALAPFRSDRVPFASAHSPQCGLQGAYAFRKDAKDAIPGGLSAGRPWPAMLYYRRMLPSLQVWQTHR